MNFLEMTGLIIWILVICILSISLITFIKIKLDEIKRSINTVTIKADTILTDYNKKIDFITKKDINIKFKRRKVIEASIDDKNIYCYSWGMNKRAAQSKLERELVNTMTKEYEGNHYNTYITSNYVAEIEKND